MQTLGSHTNQIRSVSTENSVRTYPVFPLESKKRMHTT